LSTFIGSGNYFQSLSQINYNTRISHALETFLGAPLLDLVLFKKDDISISGLGKKSRKEKELFCQKNFFKINNLSNIYCQRVTIWFGVIEILRVLDEHHLSL
jgi:hypothetical protein